MNKIRFFLFVVLPITCNALSGQSFTEINLGFPLIGEGRSVFGDYDNDGDLDIFYTGDDSYAQDGLANLYKNEGDTFIAVDFTFKKVKGTDAELADFDNDGDLDILYSGYVEDSNKDNLKLYRNDGNDTFTDISTFFNNLTWTVFTIGDFDNDGDADIITMGMESSDYYRNDGNNNFVRIPAHFPACWYGDITSADIDNDNDLDVLLSGETNTGFVSKLYENDSGVFSEISIVLPGLRLATFSWGDYNSDGKVDFLVMGEADNNVNIFRIYKNTGEGNFLWMDSDLPQISWGDAAWGDLDNDGDLDIVATTEAMALGDFYYIRNDGGDVFSIKNTFNYDLIHSVAYGDYDSDNDLDFLLENQLFRNESAIKNTLPSIPTGLSAKIETDSVLFSWGVSDDAETSSDGLTYNIRAGSLDNKNSIISSESHANGLRKVVKPGNTGQGNNYSIALNKAGRYYWSVQAIDNAYAASEFSVTDTFKILPISGIFADSTACLNEVFQVEYAGNADSVATFNWDFGGAEVISGTKAGPYNIKWNSTGNKEISIYVENKGDISDTTYLQVNVYDKPTAAIVSEKAACSGSPIILVYSGNASVAADYAWIFDGGTVISGSGQGPYNVKWNSPGSKDVSLIVTQNNCHSDASTQVEVPNQVQAHSICIVGVDSSNHNTVIWEKPAITIEDSVIIYKETTIADQFVRIGSIQINESTVFMDTNSNPQQRSNRYKIALTDTCGNESSLSSSHKTIHLLINAGIGGSWNLVWDEYEGFDFDTYTIYRGTSKKDLLKIAELPGNLFTYADIYPPIGTTYYLVEVIKPNGCNPSILKSTNSDYSSSRSNMVSSDQANPVNKDIIEDIYLSPNPAHNIVNLKFEGEMNDIRVRVYNIQGEEMKNIYLISVHELDVHELKEGVYILSAFTGNNVIIKKFIKN